MKVLQSNNYFIDFLVFQQQFTTRLNRDACGILNLLKTVSCLLFQTLCWL